MWVGGVREARPLSRGCRPQPATPQPHRHGVCQWKAGTALLGSSLCSKQSQPFFQYLGGRKASLGPTARLLGENNDF